MAIRQKVARAVRPNLGTQARYRLRMLKLIAEMARSVEYWLKAQWRETPPIMAEDALPVTEMQKELRGLSERWKKRFEEMAPKVAESFLRNQFKGTDNAMRQALREAAWTVEFRLTPAMREAFEASLAENVGLIRSIPEQYLREVEGIVMRNYTQGRNLKAMAEEIRSLYKIAAHRATFIARDQSIKANSVVTRARQKELNIEEAIWLHSHAGVKPRPTHVAMDGKRYKIDKGMWDSAVQRYVFPGEEINCGCLSRSVLPWTPAEQSRTSE